MEADPLFIWWPGSELAGIVQLEIYKDYLKKNSESCSDLTENDQRNYKQEEMQKADQYLD